MYDLVSTTLDGFKWRVIPFSFCGPKFQKSLSILAFNGQHVTILRALQDPDFSAVGLERVFRAMLHDERVPAFIAAGC